MTALADILRAQIAANGPIDIGTFMTLCLMHPEHGYYTTREPFGVSGDFTTAPEISQLFGEMIGFWAADIWGQLGQPADWHLVEYGPGRGTLMHDALRVMGNIAGCRPQIHLVEASAKLQNLQREKLSDHNPVFHADSKTLPTDAPIVIISNEFFDALPIRQLGRTPTGFEEVVIGIDDNGGLLRGRAEADAALNKYLPLHPDNMPVGAIIEISAQRRSYAAEMLTRVGAQGGAMLAIDYGYVDPVFTTTLQAVKQHAGVDVLACPGHADLTALVNFAELGQLGQDRGLRVMGPVTQGSFLNHLGIGARAKRVAANANDEQRAALISGLYRLVADDQMGVLFKAIAFCQNDGRITPAGFEHDYT